MANAKTAPYPRRGYARFARVHTIARCLFVAALFICVVGSRAASAEELVSMRIRMAWGGGEHTAWKGSLRIPGGVFSKLQCLGGDADAWSNIVVNGDTIAVGSKRPQAYQAVDVTVEAPLSAALELDLGAASVADGKPTTISLMQLRDESFNLPLDTSDNRLLIERVPGDRLRVNLGRDHVVFEPNEQWEVEIQPWMIEREGFAPNNLLVQVVESRTDRQVWRTNLPLHRDPEGTWQATRFTVPIPKTEGVYDLIVKATQPRPIPILPTVHFSQTRRVQFVVIDPQATVQADPNAAWREVVAFDPSQAGWLESLMRFPSLRQLSLNSMRMRGQGDAYVEQIVDQRANALSPLKWQTYPLPVLNPRLPHIVEVEYVDRGVNRSDAPLTVSVAEPTPDGNRRVRTIDVSVTNRDVVGDNGRRRARILFWPTTRTPQLVLSNPSPVDTVSFGRIRLLAGPARLPQQQGSSANRGLRTIFSVSEEPQFYREFGGTLQLDEVVQRELTDWVTFHESSERLTQTLRHFGFTGASMPLVADGGALMPLSRVATLPRLDTGVYAASGQDAVAKDVVEMLLRMFDREDLRLEIGIELTTPLTALEALRRGASNGDTQTLGIDVVNHRNEAFSAKSGRSIRYNPLDPRVQDEIVNVFRELTARYGHHRAFAGFRIDLDPDGYAQLPGLEWGCDPQTVAFFARDMAAELPVEMRAGLVPAQVLTEPLRPLWIQWRQRRIGDLYARISEEVMKLRADARVSVHVAPLVEHGSVADAIHPGATNVEGIREAIAQTGIDLAELRETKGIVVHTPACASPLDSLSKQGELLAFSQPAIWQSRTPGTADPSPQSNVVASAILNPRIEATLNGLDPRSLFDTASSEILVQPRIMMGHGSSRNRMNTALVSDDVSSIMLGGNVAVMDESLSDWISVFRQLPAQPFDVFQPPQPKQNEPVVSQGHPVHVASLSLGDRTYLYAVNHSPWSIQTTIAANAGQKAMFKRLGRRDSTNQSLRWVPQTAVSPNTDAGANGGNGANRANGRATWVLQAVLKPHQLIAFVISGPATVVQCDSTVDPQVVPRLQARLASTTSRLNLLKQMAPENRLGNASFEQVPEAVGIPGWNWNREPQLDVALDNTVHFEGATSLRVESTQPLLAVRSDPIPVPRTGRLALQAMLKFDATVRGSDPQQPDASPIRIAVEGIQDGRPYYRFAEVSRPKMPPRDAQAAQSPTNPPATEWTPFLLQVGSLPSDVEKLRVRFDLMGRGRVWIDDVRLTDLSMTADEQLEVSKVLALADYQLRTGHPADCAMTLERYWPKFLTEFVALPQASSVVPVQPRVGTGRVRRNGRKPVRSGFWKRWRGAILK